MPFGLENPPHVEKRVVGENGTEKYLEVGWVRGGSVWGISGGKTIFGSVRTHWDYFGIICPLTNIFKGIMGIICY